MPLKIDNLPIEEINHKYSILGNDTYQLAREYCVSPATIQRRLRMLGVVRTNKESHHMPQYTDRMKMEGRPRMSLPADEIAYKYSVLGIPMSQLQTAYGVSQGVITRRIISGGAAIRSLKEAMSTSEYLGRVRLDLPTSDLVYKYKCLGISTTDLAKEYNVSQPTIIDRLISEGISIRTIKESHNTSKYLKKFRLLLDEQSIIDKYCRLRKGLNQLGDESKCSNNVIRTLLIRHGVKRRTAAEANSKLFKQEEINDIQRSYDVNKLNTREIAKRYQCSQGAILNCLKRQGVRVRAKGESFKLQLPSNELIEKYNNLCMSVDALAHEYKCSAGVVRRILKENCISLRTKSDVVKLRWQHDLRCGNIWRKSLMEGMNIRPNKPETKVRDMLDKYFAREWQYTGNGKVFIEGLNPDFININGQKLIIEVFGTYWHGKHARTWRETSQGRVDTFAKYGYLTLILWEDDINAMSESALARRIMGLYKGKVQYDLRVVK